MRTASLEKRVKLIANCSIASKINVIPEGVYLPISKLHSILAVANLLAHNNKSNLLVKEYCYCGQIWSQSAAVNCIFSDGLSPLGVPFILQAVVHHRCTLRVILSRFSRFSYRIIQHNEKEKYANSRCGKKNVTKQIDSSHDFSTHGKGLAIS